jgi:hypothetical protein
MVMSLASLRGYETVTAVGLGRGRFTKRPQLANIVWLWYLSLISSALYLEFCPATPKGKMFKRSNLPLFVLSLLCAKGGRLATGFGGVVVEQGGAWSGRRRQDRLEDCTGTA